MHDTEANEVPDFHTYYNSTVAGGTEISSGYHLINKIVEKENLAQDYNIYVFQGSDGDDWDTEGEKAVPELEKIIGYASRVGITIVKRASSTVRYTAVETYIRHSGFLEKYPDLLQLDAMTEDATEPRLIEGIRKLTSQEVQRN